MEHNFFSSKRLDYNKTVISVIIKHRRRDYQGFLEHCLYLVLSGPLEDGGLTSRILQRYGFKQIRKWRITLFQWETMAQF